MITPKKTINLDEKQNKVALKLKNLADFLQNEKNSGIIANIFNTKKSAPKSLYIYSKPGRGKTMLVKNFYESLKNKDKTYFHFNVFMKKIHETLAAIRKEPTKYKDDLIEAVKRIITDKKLLCLDEFQVLDIADAMILGRIFTYFFKENILVVLTSNSAPRELYKNGLQRELFLEFVDNILLKKCEVIYLDSQTDYRAIYRKNLHKRYFVSNQKNRDEVKDMIETLTKSQKLEPRNIKVWGRDVKIKNTFENIAVINFDEICRTALSAADYNGICKTFDLIFLLKLPILTKEDKNEMRRFMLFIDEVYENNTALIILAKSKIENIYADKELDNSFDRAISRLKEIKSDEYYNNSKFIKNYV